jgi:hypothetical protein
MVLFLCVRYDTQLHGVLLFFFFVLGTDEASERANRTEQALMMDAFDNRFRFFFV